MTAPRIYEKSPRHPEGPLPNFGVLRSDGSREVCDDFEAAVRRRLLARSTGERRPAPCTVGSC